MPTRTYGVSLSGGSVNISASLSRTSEGGGELDPPLPVGAAGTLTTRTDADTGEITAADAGHGIETGNIVDVHWPGGVQYGVTVGTVDGTAIPIDSGSGDDLPAENDPVVVSKQVQINAAIDGDELSILGIVASYTDPNSTARVHVDMQDESDATIEELDLVANVPQIFDIAGNPASNVFTGNPIAKIMASNGSATEPAVLKATWLVDPTP